MTEVLTSSRGPKRSSSTQCWKARSTFNELDHCTYACGLYVRIYSAVCEQWRYTSSSHCHNAQRLFWIFIFPHVYKCVVPFLSGIAHKQYAPATIIDERPSLHAFGIELHDHESTLYNHDLIHRMPETLFRRRYAKDKPSNNPSDKSSDKPSEETGMKVPVRPRFDQSKYRNKPSNAPSDKPNDESQTRTGSKDTPETLCMSHDYESPAQAQWSLCIVQQENRQLRTELEQSRQHGEEASNARMRGNAAHKVEVDALKKSLADSEAKGSELNGRLAEAKGRRDHFIQECFALRKECMAHLGELTAQELQLRNCQLLIHNHEDKRNAQAKELTGAKAQIDELNKELVKVNTDRDAYLEVLAGVKVKTDELNNPIDSGHPKLD